MAFNSYRKQFRGSLNNIETKELSELDFRKSTFEERKKFVYEKYKKNRVFYDSYIGDGEEYFKVALKNNDELSSEINIFKYIERDADYLLSSSDVIKEKRQQEYKFLVQNDFKKLLHKERMNLSLDDSELMEVLEVPKRNGYIAKDIEIEKSDFLREETADVLKCYEAARVHLKPEMQRLKERKGSIYSLGFLKRNLGSLKADMVDSKKMLQGIKDPSIRLGDESGKFYTEIIDYTNPIHIKGILKTVKLTGELEPDSELSHIAYDMEVAIAALRETNSLDDMDLEIIECLNAGYTYTDIAKEIKRDRKVVYRRLKRIFDKISLFYQISVSKFS